MMDVIVSLVVTLVVYAISLAVIYLIQKAAVAAGIRDAMWNLEVSMRNAVKAGVQEALKGQEQAGQAHMQSAVKQGVQAALEEIEKNKLGGNNG